MRKLGHPLELLRLIGHSQQSNQEEEKEKLKTVNSETRQRKNAQRSDGTRKKCGQSRSKLI
jgi:hypothetical protein